MPSYKHKADHINAGSLCEVLLVSGFLGAGKTTFFRNILRWPIDLISTVVIVNEFGRVGIDGEILEGTGTSVIELVNGCICCTIQGDLVRTLKDIMNRFHPKRLLIEATGVADPLEILSTLKQPQFERKLKVDKVVAVMDADMWEGRENFGPLFYNQIKAADLVLLNKVDLLPTEIVPQYLHEIRGIHPSCAVLPTHYCHVDPEVLWSPVTQRVQELELSFSHQHAHHDVAHEYEDTPEMGYVPFAFEEETPFEEDCFRRFMAALPIEIYRVKGYALLGAKRFFINHVGGKTEWVALNQRGPTKLAFLGWEVEEQEILIALRDCIPQHKGD